MLNLNPLQKIQTAFTDMTSGPMPLGAMLDKTCSYLADASPSDPKRIAMRTTLWEWENEDSSIFGGKSSALSRSRREDIYARLGLGKREADLFDAKFAPAPATVYSSPLRLPSASEIRRKVQQQLREEDRAVVPHALLLHHQQDPSVYFQVDEGGSYIVSSQLSEIWQSVSDLPLECQFENIKEASTNMGDFFEEMAEEILQERLGGRKHLTMNHRRNYDFTFPSLKSLRVCARIER